MLSGGPPQVITPQAGVVIARRYTLTRPLARGAMGSVWVARHHDLEIEVTVKFMDPSLCASADARARFEHEARSAARLGSQHVVQVLDYGIESDTPYIVMELLKGETLATRLGREGRLSLPAVARLVVQIGKALRTAHEAGLVHRDLKPGNVFLAIKDEDEVAKVLDFGIAKTLLLGNAATGTESGMLLGSAHYMSPEQVRNASLVDHRSDLWSLGVILYRALVGRLPFPGKDFGDVLVRVCTDPLPLPSSIAPDLPARLDGFFTRALARDPAQRFQTARGMAEALCSIAMDDPPVPPPEPAFGQRTIRMDLLSVPPPPPSSDARVVYPLPQTPKGTHIMLVEAGAAWPPPPPAGDEPATLAHRPEPIVAHTAADVEPTLRVAQHVTTMPAPTPFHDDPPTVPVSLRWPLLWAAGAALLLSGSILVAFRVGGRPTAAPLASVTSTPTRPSPAPGPPVASSVVPASAGAAASPQVDAGAAATASAATASAQASAAPSASVRRRGSPRVKVEDGIIRDPFKP